MAALPYMQLYVADYLADTAHLTTKEHGAYLLLMFNYWQRGESFKAKDEQKLNKKLATIAKLSLEEWNEIKESISEFFCVSETEWQHNRIERDLITVNNKSANASVAGKRSAEKRALANKEYSNERSTNVKQSLNHTDTDTDTDTDIEIKKINKKNTVTIETMVTSVRGLSEKTAQEYFDYRKGKRKPLTDRAWKGISKALNEFIAIGGNPDQALNKAMEKDWIGLESEWLQRLFYPNVSQFKLPEQQEKIPKGMSKTKVEGWFNDGLGYWKDPKLFDELTGNSWYTVYLSDKSRVPVEMIPAFEAKRYGGTK